MVREGGGAGNERGEGGSRSAYLYELILAIVPLLPGVVPTWQLQSLKLTKKCFEPFVMMDNEF